MATPIQVSGNGVASGALASSFTSNVRAGTTLICLSLATTTTENLTAITDTRGNTWAQAHDVTVGAMRFEVWTAPNGSAGANTVTCTYSATAGARRIWIMEVGDLGNWVAGPNATLDQTVAQDPMTCASVTTVADNGLAVLIVATDTNASFLTILDAAGGPWTFMTAGSASIAAYKVIGPSTPSLTPLMDMTGTATRTGESLLYTFATPAVEFTAACYVG